MGSEGVAPYRWPHQRHWTPGENDKRGNRTIWFLLIIFTVFIIGILLNFGSLGFQEWLMCLIFPILGEITLLTLMLLGSSKSRDVQVEEVRHLDLEPETLSLAMARMLDEDGTAYDREGPRQEREGYWLDTFILREPPLEGFSLVVERNPLIARVDKAAVMVRCRSTAMGPMGRLKERVDEAVMRAQLERFESANRSERPDLVIYDG